MKNPVTLAEWQEAVDMANTCLAIDAARKYRLVTGGPVVDVERCCEILDGGKERGMGHIERCMGSFLQ